jgi:uncharacterized membrane protein
MPVVEQTAVIKAPMAVVMKALSQVEEIPGWATVTGLIDNIQGSGPGMTYEWHYSINNMAFEGKSEVIEQTETTLITRTTGDIASIWTIKLAPAGKKSTAIRVVVEYMPPNVFVEILADLVLEQLNDPEIARENMARFKAMVEKKAAILEEQMIAGH